ncbi:ABC-2 type transport system permease protein [Actinoalloteichus hoggarensis]|uniref:ABC-2 type transporter n=1 Tax=Actinoalloteichus hoggarensis TaxID=1470176 RepID=A0A221VYV9_9PSEU|nr:ABC transporter permease [Actinoalloteichus hoggarensis]ASO18664.1 ABC-2 type transporter [Actinoalloteichus hoggarensis]MBB5919895.1 ABC-2 type transport system permease protein [Actinoalloteichus hoggarensis]
MLAIARGELIQILRNRSVLLTVFLVPAAMAAFFIYQHDVFEQLGGGLGVIAALLVFYVAGFGLYTTAVTTLASRRQNLFLKRLRSTATGDAGILTGLLIPVTVISLLQAALVLIVLGVVAGAPADVALVVVAVLAVVAMMVGLGLATAGITNSPEHAQVTTLPIGVGTIALASWIGFGGTEELTLLKRLLPGGSAAELVVAGWNGGASPADSLLLLAPTAAWVVISVVLAAMYFRWEPRR